MFLKTIIANIEDSVEITLDDARVRRQLQVGDVMEEPIDCRFSDARRCRRPSGASSARSRGERTRIRDSLRRVWAMLSGEFSRRAKLVIMLNKFREAEAIIPYREQNHREHYHQGEPIRAVLKRVEETPKGPRLILSRGDPLFVQALFKLEVPEIQQNIVEIRAAAREVGSRTKIAVFSRDDSIDPVGACVGLKGSRVQAVVNELNGERIDIVPWSPDPERFAKLALPRRRLRACSAIPRRKRFKRSWTRINSRWRLDATDRTCALRQSSRAVRSISTRAANGWSAVAQSRRSLPRCPRKPRKWLTCD